MPGVVVLDEGERDWAKEKVSAEADQRSALPWCSAPSRERSRKPAWHWRIRYDYPTSSSSASLGSPTSNFNASAAPSENHPCLLLRSTMGSHLPPPTSQSLTPCLNVSSCRCTRHGLGGFGRNNSKMNCGLRSWPSSGPTKAVRHRDRVIVRFGSNPWPRAQSTSTRHHPATGSPTWRRRCRYEAPGRPATTRSRSSWSTPFGRSCM